VVFDARGGVVELPDSCARHRVAVPGPRPMLWVMLSLTGFTAIHALRPRHRLALALRSRFRLAPWRRAAADAAALVVDARRVEGQRPGSVLGSERLGAGGRSTSPVGSTRAGERRTRI